MAGFHVYVGACVRADGFTEVLCSTRPGCVEVYDWEVPIGAFSWPMKQLTRRSGTRNVDYDGMLEYLRASGRYYWIARIFKSQTGLLDMHIRWAYVDYVCYYILEFPAEHVSVRADFSGWPQPRDFYLAVRAIDTGVKWTIDEYGDHGQLWGTITDSYALL